MAKVEVFEIQIKGQKDVFELQARLKELKKEIAATKDPTLAEQLTKEFVVLQVELKKAKAAATLAQKELEAKDSTIGGYKQLSAQLTLARERFKNLATQAAQGGNVTAEALERARKEAALLDSQLKKVDAATGVFGRNVGNYAGSLKGFFGSLKQTIQASGIIGRGGIGNFANQIIGLVNQLEKGVEAYNTAFSSTFNITKKVADATGEVVTEYAKERISLDTLTTALLDENTKREDKDKILQTLQNQYPDYFKNIDLDKSKTDDITAAYRGANAELLNNLKLKTKTAILEKQLVDAVNAQLENQKAQAKVSGDISDQAVKSGGNLFQFLTNQLDAAWADQNAQTQQAALNVGEIEAAVNGLVDSVAATIPELSANYGNIEDLTKDAANKTAEETKKAEGIRRAEYKKTVEEAKKLQEQFVKDRATFEKQQSAKLLDLQTQFKELAIGNIQDENARAIAEEKLAFDLRKAAREREFAEIVANAKKLEEQAVKAFGKGSAEVLNIITNNQTSIEVLQQQYNFILEQDAIAHQAKLTSIEEKGQAERAEQDTQAFQARIDALNAQQGEIERAYQLQVAVIQEQLAKGLLSAQAANEAQIQARKDAIAEETALIDRQIDQRLFQTEEERQGLVLRRQQLNTELAQLENDQTAQLQEEEEKRSEARKRGFEDFLNGFSQALNGASQLLEAFSARELKGIDAQIEARGKNIADLEEKLETATGLEAANLQQRIENEERYAENLAKQREKAQQDAAAAQKAIAITQSIISGLLAVNNTLASPIPFPGNVIAAAGVGVLAAVQTAAIIAQPLATGGIVGEHITGVPIKRSNGDDTFTTLKRKEAVLTEVQQRRVGLDRLAAAGVPGFARGGLVGAPTPPSLSELGTETSNVLGLLKETNRLASITAQKLNALKVELNTQTIDDIETDKADRTANKKRVTLGA